MIAAVVVGWQLVQTKLFQIEEIKVEQLVQVTPQVVPNDQLQRLASGLRGDSLLLLNQQQIVDSWLTRLPSLEELYLKKEFPNRLIIQYIPRVAFSQLVSPTNTFLVDREGFIFAKNETVDYLPKVIIDQGDVTVGKSTSAKGLRLAQHLIEGLRNTSPKLVSILFRHNWLELTMSSEPRILVGDDKLPMSTIQEISALFSKFAQDKNYPKEVDMRYDRPILRY